MKAIVVAMDELDIPLGDPGKKVRNTQLSFLNEVHIMRTPYRCTDLYMCACVFIYVHRYMLTSLITTLPLSQWVGHFLMKWAWLYKHYGMMKACRRQLNGRMSSS